MKETKASIQKEMFALVESIRELELQEQKNPEVVRLRGELKEAMKRAHDNVAPHIAEAKGQYDSLLNRLHVLEKETEVEVPEGIRKLLSDCRLGTNWGPKPFKVLWVSPGERFFIFTCPGHTFWASMMAPRKYAPSTHYLMDVKKYSYDRNGKHHGHDIFSRSMVMEAEGRLTKEKRQAWIDFALAEEGK